MTVVGCFCLKTRNTIPFGWPIKRGRRITLFLLLISSRRSIVSVAIRGSEGTDFVAIHIVIIVVFRIRIRVVVVTVGIIIDVIFGIVIIVHGNTTAAAKAPLVIVIVGVVFGCRIRLASG